MRIHNLLPQFHACIERWKKPPTPSELRAEYLIPAEPIIGPLFGSDAESMTLEIRALDWKTYRDRILRLDPGHELERVRKHLSRVEDFFGFSLEGEIILFGCFEMMDGYARFDRGTHRMYLGIDENFHAGPYIDILTVHELTHVARESRPGVWQGFGLNPHMTNHEFTEHQPVIEHLMGEGYSCAVSERLNPGHDPWLYTFQTAQSFERIKARRKQIDRVIKREIEDPNGDYGRLYQTRLYGRDVPQYAQYTWAWSWVKQVAQDFADGRLEDLVDRCSKDFLEHALRFE